MILLEKTIGILEELKPSGIEDGFFFYLKERLIRKMNTFSVGTLLKLSFSFGEKEERYTLDTEDELAALIEILDIAVIIYDDIVDRDCILEGNPTTLLLNNDCLIFAVLSRLNMVLEAESFSYVLSNLKDCINGEAADVNIKLDENSSEDMYFSRIIPKSASLYRLYLLGYPSKRDIWSSVADHLACHYQIKNDIKNICGPLKSDIQNKKASLPMIKAKEYAKDLGFSFFYHLERFIEKEDDGTFLSYFNESKSIEYCTFLCQYYKKKAIEEINGSFRDGNESKERLLQLIRGADGRKDD